MKKTASFLAAFLIIAATTAAQARAVTKKEIKDILDKNPDIVLDVLSQNKEAFFDIVKQAAQEDQMRQEEAQEKEEQQKFQAALKDPLKPVIDSSSHIRGKKDAKFTLVEYADFQCPYCGRVVPTVQALEKEYGDNLRLVFKSMPLVNIHQYALISAEYFEAISLQSQEKAWKFHDTLFANQDKLVSQGEAYCKQTAQALGLNMSRLERDIHSKAVKDRIAANTEEFHKFGFSGTPAFLLNGAPIYGAFPLDYFQKMFKLVANAEAQTTKG